MTSQLVPHPVTGEVIDLASMTTTEKAELKVGLDDLIGDLVALRQSVVDHIAGEMDKHNARSATVGGWKLETNPASEEVYLIDELRDALKRLISEGVLDAAVERDVIVQPPPKPQEPRVSKRALNKLAAHPRVAETLAPIRRRRDNRRTLKLERVGRGG